MQRADGMSPLHQHLCEQFDNSFLQRGGSLNSTRMSCLNPSMRAENAMMRQRFRNLVASRRSTWGQRRQIPSNRVRKTRLDSWPRLTVRCQRQLSHNPGRMRRVCRLMSTSDINGRPSNHGPCHLSGPDSRQPMFCMLHLRLAFSGPATLQRNLCRRTSRRRVSVLNHQTRSRLLVAVSESCLTGST